ncbi:MAG: hypothetical protein AAGU06_01730 [Candidatus Shapirobacteria bacterium]
MGNNDEIEHRLKLLSKPFENEGLIDATVVKYLKNYIANVSKMPQLSKIILSFQNEQNQADQEEESLRLKALDEIESKEAKLIDELEERKIFNFDSTYLRLKLIKEDANERNIDEPEYNLSQLEKILLKLDDNRTKDPFDIDSRYENLDTLILFLRNSENKAILNSIFTKNQQRINCRKFVSINYLMYKKEKERFDQIKNQSGWGIWFEISSLISKKSKNIISVKEIKPKIDYLNNEFLTRLEFGIPITLQKLPNNIKEIDNGKTYKISFTNEDFLSFNKSTAYYRYYRVLRDRLGLPLYHQEAIDLGLAELNEGEGKYKKVKDLAVYINRKIDRKKLGKWIKLSTDYGSSYTLNIKRG